MSLIKKHGVTIIISFAIGVSIFYLQPVLDWIGTKALDSLILISDLFSNYYYSSIAKNDPNLFTSYTTYILSIAFIFWLYTLFQKQIDKKRETLKQIDSTLKKIRTTITNSGEKKPEKEKSKDELIEELKQLEPQSERFKQKIENSRSLKALGILIILLGILLFANYTFYSTISMENTKFRNKLIILAPKLDESKIKELKSEWYQMQTKEDYKSIENKIKKYRRGLLQVNCT